MAAYTCLLTIGELIFQIYKDRGIVSYICNVQAPDKIKRPHKRVVEKGAMANIFPFAIHKGWTS